MFLEHDVIVCARNGSPLIIGKGDGEMFVSSDPHALTPYTQRVVFLEDGEIATLTKDSMSLSTLKGKNFNPDITVLEDDWGDSESRRLSLTFMLKEIYEQPDALRHCISGRLDRVRGNGGLGGLKLEPRDLAKIPHVRLAWIVERHYNAAEIGQMMIEKLATNTCSGTHFE
jgi:glucosamine--fructose-6-phosphate aminotransferase (isomerizing)